MVWSGRCRVFREGRREDLAGVVYFRMLWAVGLGVAPSDLKPLRPCTGCS